MHAPRSLVFGLHLAISVTVMLVLLSIMLLWWFPNGLFETGGGWAGLKILLPIDLVLGPALTWFFYRPGKPSARFDLAAIAMVQLLALGYGVHAVWSQHPSALVVVGDTVNTLTPSDRQLARAALAEDGREWREPSTLNPGLPPLVVARDFEGDEARAYMAELFNDGLEATLRADRYLTPADNWASDKLRERAMSTAQIASAIGSEPVEGHLYFPLRSMHGRGIAEIDANSGRLQRVHALRSTAGQTPSSAALSPDD